MFGWNTINGTKKTMKRYKLDFREESLYCWDCGEACNDAVLIEWQKGHEKQILCDTCLGMCVRNEKDIKILANIMV